MNSNKQTRRIATILMLGLCGVLCLTLNGNIPINIQNKPLINPTSSINSPKSADSFQGLYYFDYEPYGVTIYGPSYVQYYPYQSSSIVLNYYPDYYNGQEYNSIFTQYEYSINGSDSGIQQETNGNDITIDITLYTHTIGNFSLSLSVFDNAVNIWYNKTTVINVTNGINVNQYYQNVSISQNAESSSFNWQFSDNMANNYSYSLYLNGTLKQYSPGPFYTYNSLSLALANFGIYNVVGQYNVIVAIRDYSGYVTLDTFTIWIVPSGNP